jgi:vitamin K-dependent gamma-carboxylase-like protein
MAEAIRPLRTGQKVLLGFIGVWLAFQVAVPLRHFLYPGNPSWTEQGHRFAWQMKLRDKDATAAFRVRDPASGREWRIEPRAYLARHQAEEMASRPDMILQLAHHLARVWAEQRGIAGVEVRARVCASLNGRKAALLIDPERDLARVERSLRHADWILPLEQPFERPEPRTGLVDLHC